jgi:magnesium chelatase family protein
MLAKLNTFALVGIDALPVEVEVDVSSGLPKTVLVGLPELAVKESVHRIERALANLGYDRHPGRTVINLAPPGITQGGPLQPRRGAAVGIRFRVFRGRRGTAAPHRCLERGNPKAAPARQPQHRVRRINFTWASPAFSRTAAA